MIHEGISVVKRPYFIVSGMALFIILYVFCNISVNYYDKMTLVLIVVDVTCCLNEQHYITTTRRERSLLGSKESPASQQLCTSAEIWRSNIPTWSYRQPASLQTNPPSDRSGRPCFHCFIIQERASLHLGSFWLIWKRKGERENTGFHSKSKMKRIYSQ